MSTRRKKLDEPTASGEHPRPWEPTLRNILEGLLLKEYANPPRNEWSTEVDRLKLLVATSPDGADRLRFQSAVRAGSYNRTLMVKICH
jgi:hypothetical protein